MIRQIYTRLAWLVGPKSRFDIRDTVQLKEGGELMVVKDIHVKFNQEPTLECEWNDPKKGIQHGVFSEGSLRPFDWEAAYRDLPKS